MTREEKSNLLNELLEYEEKNDIGLLTRADRREFQQWISNALEQEPTTKNDLGVDCISRQIISDYVESHIQEINTGYGDLNRHTNSILRMIVDYIENMPSVTPIRPKGHWIVQLSNKEQGERDFIWWKCSECGQVIFSETEHDRLEFHAFCGRCGSDNREVEE